MKCVSKRISRVNASFPPAEEASKRLSSSRCLAPGSRAIPESLLLSTGSKSGTSIESEASLPQRPGLHSNTQKFEGDSDTRFATAEASGCPTGPNVLNHRAPISRHNSNHIKSMDMSNVPKTSAAMTDAPLPGTLSRTPHINNSLDSYRPEPPPAKMKIQRIDSHARPGRSQPPPLRPEGERENFLRHAPKAEKDRYLQQHRRAICKEVTCFHWQNKGFCRHGDDCIYSHEDTHVYFPLATRPAKRWTCFFWLSGDSGCPDHEEDCLFAHYDTGLYANRRGYGSQKHITCSWWSVQNSCYKGEDCLFAHCYTGIEAREIGCPGPRPGFERKSQQYRPQAATRQSSNSWLPQADISLSPSSPVTGSAPPIRDTPLSPVEPDGSGSESEEYKPPDTQHAASIISSTGSVRTSPYPFQPQTITKPSPRMGPNAVIINAGCENANVILQPAAPSLSAPLAIPTEPAADAVSTPATKSKQYARRTGGVKRSSTSDPRLRKPEATKPEPSTNRNGERDESAQGEAQMPSMTAESHVQSVGAPNLLRCQTCKTLVLAKQVMSHKCRVVPDIPTMSSQPASSYPSSSRAIGVIGMSEVSQTFANNLSTTGRVEGTKSPDVSIDKQEIDQVFLRNLTDGSAPKSACHGAKRALPGSEADAMFIPNKRRKVDPYALLRAAVSSHSINGTPVTGPESAESSPQGVQLSISELIELEALRKEFEMGKEKQLDDDMTTLKSLQARKRKRLAEEDAASLLAEAAELEQRTAKRRADMERELKEQEEAVARRRAERELKLREEEEAEKADFDRIRAARKEHEMLRLQAELEGSRPHEGMGTNGAYKGPSSSSSLQQESAHESAQWLLRGTGISTPIQGVTVPSSSRHIVEARLDKQQLGTQDSESSEKHSTNPTNSAIETTPLKGARLEPANQDGTDKEVPASSPQQPSATCSKCRKKHVSSSEPATHLRYRKLTYCSGSANIEIPLPEERRALRNALTTLLCTRLLLPKYRLQRLQQALFRLRSHPEDLFQWMKQLFVATAVENM